MLYICMYTQTLDCVLTKHIFMLLLYTSLTIFCSDQFVIFYIPMLLCNLPACVIFSFISDVGTIFPTSVKACMNNIRSCSLATQVFFESEAICVA